MLGGDEECEALGAGRGGERSSVGGEGLLGKDVDEGSEVESTCFCDGARGGDGANVLDDGCQEGGGLAGLRELELCCNDGDCSICCDRVNEELVKLGRSVW